MENKKLDQFLREQVDSGQFPMQEAHWLKALALIEEEESTKKRPFLFWKYIGISTLLLVVGLTAFLMTKTKDNKATTKQNLSAKHDKKSNNTAQKYYETEDSETDTKEKQSASPKISPVNNTVKTEVDIEKSTELKNTNTNDKAIIISNPTSIPKFMASAKIKNKKNSFETQRNTKYKSTKSVHSKKAIVQPTNIDVSSSLKKVETQKLREKSSTAMLEMPSENMQSNTYKELQSGALKSKKNKKVKIQSESKLVMESNAKEEIAKSTPLKTVIKKLKSNKKKIANMERNANANYSDLGYENIQIAETIEDKNIAQINASRLVKNKQLINKKANGEPVIYRNANRDETIYNPRYLPNAKSSSKQEIISKDTTQNTIAVKEIPSLETKKISKDFWWFIQAGLFANKGFSGNNLTPISIGFAPYISTGIQKELSSRLSINSQIGLTYYNALNTTYQQTTYKYSFGYDSSFFKIDYKKMMQLYLAINFIYHLNKKHQLMAGFGINYMADVQSKVQQNNITQTQMGYYTGFNNVDFFTNIGYNYQINNNMNVIINYSQGFVDATKNTYFQNSTINKQGRFAIGLKYNLKKLNKK
jgi:hypothetical protein